MTAFFAQCKGLDLPICTYKIENDYYSNIPIMSENKVVRGVVGSKCL